ncbi:molecular chaperone TorD [Bacillus mesophilum]|uniref:Molecular chaperone TorD n=2 Tax=Bacillus mesophilum TaxID=1071718 RepID=A0A7V7UVI1_9BACI|nr:molecular chaperone TorD [Bacillus mesophilum]
MKMEAAAENFMTVWKDRKDQYDFLHYIFSQPVSAADLEAWDLSGISEKADLNNDLRDFIHTLSAGSYHDTADREGKVFLKLFFGPEHVMAPPWESVYRSKEGLLFGESTLAVREKLRQFGLVSEGENKEPEDHIAIELEFMKYLMTVSAEAIQDQDDLKLKKAMLYQFLLVDEHLVQWVKPFTERIIVAAESKLYRGSATLLRDFIIQEHQYLSAVREVLEYE